MKTYHDSLVRLLQEIGRQQPSPAHRRFDVNQINDTIHRALSAAGLNPQSDSLKSIPATIQQALSMAGLTQRPAASTGNGVTIDGVAQEVTPAADAVDGTVGLPEVVEPRAPGEFVTRSFTNSAGTRVYKLYVPANYSDESSERIPVVVMLHGCTQSPDDFATGTRMNALADRHGFLVIYPAQAANANGSKCWNWFRPEDQSRESGEPSIIAGITREVASSYRVDERRIFVAGMSAGAAMAVILGATYPELFAAVGAHSGLPYGAAHDIPSAFGAMKGSGPLAGAPNLAAGPAAHKPRALHWVPTIVFHGDRDNTVAAHNGDAIVQAIVGRADESLRRIDVNADAASGGRTYSRTVYGNAARQPMVEQWVLHGAGHAWSGGDPDGSFTDASGPDASAEIIRFFYLQQRAGTA